MEVFNSQLCKKIFCGIPATSNEATCNKNLILAYECCKEHGLNVVWIPENDLAWTDDLKLKPSKENVFILSEFGGPLFEYLQSFECTVVGPQCLLDSVNNSNPILAKAVFNLAMKGITATSTGFNIRKKKDIEMKIQFMGGVYSSELTSCTTHLIAMSVADFSLKLKAARSRAIPIMTPEWLNAVWDARMQENIHGNDPEFASHACLLFQGFVMCVSQISVKKRDAIKKIFEANGGQYSAHLEKGKTNLLLTPSAKGDKYTYARRWKIRCLKPEWVQSSLDQGYVCDPELYAVETTVTCSTPEAHCRSEVVKFNNDSLNSTIVNSNSITSEIDETNVNASTPPIQHQSDPRPTEPLECLDLILSLKAGRFLEGFKIFLIGFDGPQMEKLRRVLKNAGVIQLNTINDESISHVIAGNTGKEDRKQLQQLTRKPHVVTVEWLTQSLRLKAPAPEAEYLHPYYKNLFTLESQKSCLKEPTPELVSMTTRDSQDDASVQYIRTLSKQSTAKNFTIEQNNNCSEEKDLQTAFEDLTTADEIEVDEDAPVLLNFLPADALFSDVTFQLVGLVDADLISWTTDLIESNGGRVLANGAKYKVTAPVIHAELLPDDPVGQPVVINTFWIEDCIDEDRLVEIEIYHLPIKFQNSQIFTGCVVSFSGIQGRLRDFLYYLVDHLGGKQQEFFSRKMVEANDVCPSTHLVCPKAEGKKYEKAVKWGVPVVNAEWIIASATSSTRLKETDYPPEGGEPTVSKDFTAPTPLTVVRIFRPPGVPAEKLSAPISFPAISFDAPTDTVMGPPTIPAMLPVLTDPTSELLLQTSNGTNTFGISPTPRPALSNMPTPETPYGRLLNPNPSPDTRKLWKHALDNRVRLTPRTDDSPTITPPQQKEKDILNSVAMDYFENLHKKMLSCCWEVTDEVTNAEASPLPASNLPPLHEARIFIGQEIEGDKRLQMEEFITTLGGRVILQHCQEVTHFICQGELAASEDMQNAKKWNQLFVLPQWIIDCEFAACRLKETYYQPSLNGLLPGVAPASSGLLETTHELLSLPSSLAEEEKPLQAEQVLRRPTQEISLPNDPVASQSENVPVHLAPPPCSSDGASRISLRENASQRLNESQRLNASQYSGHSFRIMFSGMSQEDRDSCVQIIEVLGGIAIDGKHYDSTCTHLVVAKLECNDKLMTSIAAGKWIVHPGWIARSEQTYHFVDERQFEWGNPASNDSISKEEARIAAAAYYWRTSRNRGLSTGPFQGIKAALHLRKKNDVFQQLIEAGGGEVIAPELALENGKTNLCVLDSREISKIQLPLYASKGIYCVPPNYLRDLILAIDKKCQWAECVLPEFLPFLDTIPSTHI